MKILSRLQRVHKDELELEEKKKLQQQRLSSNSSNDNNYPDIKKVALSETSWSLEELFSRSDTFWQSFEELEYDDGAGAGDGTVDHNRLQKALIKSNKKYFATSGDVLLMVEIMLRTGNIVETSFHKYRKRRKK